VTDRDDTEDADAETALDPSMASPPQQQTAPPSEAAEWFTDRLSGDAGRLSSARDITPVDAGGDAQPLRKVVEAILVVADQPVTDVDIAQVTEQPTAAVGAVLAELAAAYAADGRGFVLREVAGGWRLYSAPDCAGYVERFVLEGQQARLTQAALETLAVVAYRQPVTRASISAIRGVNVEAVVRTLLTRGLIEEVGHESTGAVLYGTTTYFLSRLGLNSLEELPSLAPFLPVDVDSIAEQL
jgi:segregation and condensation protein B